MWIVLMENSQGGIGLTIYRTYQEAADECVKKANANQDIKFYVYELDPVGEAKAISAKFKDLREEHETPSLP